MVQVKVFHPTDWTLLKENVNVKPDYKSNNLSLHWQLDHIVNMQLETMSPISKECMQIIVWVKPILYFLFPESYYK